MKMTLRLPRSVKTMSARAEGTSGADGETTGVTRFQLLSVKLKYHRSLR